MRNLCSYPLLALAGLTTFIQAVNNSPWNHPERRDDLLDLLSVIEGGSGGSGRNGGGGGGGGNGGNKGNAAKTIAVTNAAQASPAPANNGSCAAVQTVTIEKTVTQTASEACGDQGPQLSFATTTVYSTGVAPTVTVTSLPQMTTQMLTVTVTVNNTVAAVPSVQNPSVSGTPASIVMPGAASTAGSAGNASGTKTIAIVTTSSSAVGNTASPLAVGSPGHVATGQGTIQENGGYDCQCLCGVGSFDNAMGPGEIQGTTLTTMTSAAPTNSATLSSASIVKSSPAVGGAGSMSYANVASPSTTSAGNSNAGSTATIASIVSSSIPAQVPSPSTIAPISSATPAPVKTQSQASVLELTAPNPNATPNAKASDHINISTYSLQSELVLGHLKAKKTAGARNWWS